MRSLRKLLLTFFISLFFVASSAVNSVYAAENIFGITGAKSAQDYLKEYCDKRSGDLMNLETWFSGKCSKDTDTLSGEGVGFGDIIFLHGVEFILSPQYKSFSESILDKLKFLEKIKETLSQTPVTNINSIALINQDPDDKSPLSTLSKLTTGMITFRPASTVDFVDYTLANINRHKVTNEAYAAGPGYGFSALSPILPIWKAFRNIAYLLFAFGFVLYGMMIMFRIRIDSKTAATIQLAIPKLISTLLLITFSYAIVGFLIDISTLATAMSINILRAGGILTTGGFTFAPLMASGNSPLGAIGSFVINFFSAWIVSPFIFFNLLVGGLPGIVAGTATFILSFTVTQIGFIVSLVLFLALIISYSKLIFKLFQSYLSVLINLMFAPIILLGNLMPGSTSFGSWMRSIYGNLAVFPVATFFLTLSYALMCQPLLSITTLVFKNFPALNTPIEALLGVKNLSSVSNIWTPPMTVGAGLGTGAGSLVGASGSLILATIGFGLLFMCSKYVEMVEKALNVPPFPYGAAIGEALKSGVGLNESWAKSGYKYLPGFLGRGARSAYPAREGEDPSVRLGAINTGINLNRLANKK